jgi:hypothetical protein
MTECKLCTVPTTNDSGVCGFCLDYEPPADGYEVREPGKLIVVYVDGTPELGAERVLSVVRYTERVSTDSDLYRRAAELADGLDIVFQMTDAGIELTLYKVA